MPQASRPLRLRDWRDIDWHQSKKAVKDLRGQIFRATKNRDHRKLRSLQKLMLRSRANAEVSVRQVTQINKGKKTPGVDGRVATTPDERTQIIKELLQNDENEIHPVKRVYIPKSNGKVRPLGIPTIVIRARQAMVKNALEPQWEAKFEPCSYGFRPGRSCHDAIGRIFRTALPQGKKKWILDADIKGAFDNIGHTALMENLDHFPAKEEIRKWLKAGVVEDGIFSKTDQGTPQGGVISPLLANIALHGMEQALGVTYYKRGDYTKCSSKRLIVRYADDFVVFTESREDAELCQAILTDWLMGRGLEISTEKTRIRSIREGFDFLGFQIREYTERQTPKPILLIKPSLDSVKDFRNRIRQDFYDLKGHNVDTVLEKLNPILRGWGYYFRHVATGETFSKLDDFLWRRVMKWTKLTHPKKSTKWRINQYFGFTKDKISKWIFGNPDSGRYLLRLGMHIPIRRHILVKHGASPDNPDERAYWTKREKRKVELLPTTKYKRLAKMQKGLCPICLHTLYGDEELHIHHKIPKSKGGSESLSNLQLLHGVCHRQDHSSGSISQKQTA